MRLIDIALQGKIILKSGNIPNPLLDSRIILSLITGLSKEEIIFNPDHKVTSEQEKQFFLLIDQRLRRKPISHIVGYREFFGHDFIVGSQVLDPRPDSEALVELVNQLLLNSLSEDDLSILELGPGSGCLIISILKSNPSVKGIAAEISEEAIKICKQNIVKYNLQGRLNLICSDLFAKVDKLQKFNFIISNPPYIPSNDINSLQDEVRFYEPRQALDGGNDGLDFYRKIASQSSAYLKKGGMVIVEIGQGQEEQVEKIFKSNNFYLKDHKKDLSQIVRVLSFAQ